MTPNKYSNSLVFTAINGFYEKKSIGISHYIMNEAEMAQNCAEKEKGTRVSATGKVMEAPERTKEIGNSALWIRVRKAGEHS